MMLEALTLIVFAAGLVALGVAYWDQRKLLRETLAAHGALVEHIKAAATTGRRDVAAAYVDLINAVQFHMPASGQPGMTAPTPQLRPAPSDLDLWQLEQERQAAIAKEASLVTD